ncbi:MAG: hypothetical protein N3F09_09550 [Bacteroidia bacterium]|nr:hypothetical protein [Bacteroidia bacterium]
MDELKKTYDELKSKPENEFDAFDQDALEGLEGTDLNVAGAVKRFYDIKFQNRFGGLQKTPVMRYLYFAAAALLLIALFVGLWRFFAYDEFEKNTMAVIQKEEVQSSSLQSMAESTEMPETKTEINGSINPKDEAVEAKRSQKSNITPGVWEKSASAPPPDVVMEPESSEGSKGNVYSLPEKKARGAEFLKSDSKNNKHASDEDDKEIAEGVKSTEAIANAPDVKAPAMKEKSHAPVAASMPVKNKTDFYYDKKIFINPDAFEKECSNYIEQNQFIISELIIEEKKSSLEIKLKVADKNFASRHEKEIEKIIRKNLNKEYEKHKVYFVK